MYEKHTIGVVVPAYNEAGQIGDVIRTMPAYVDRIYLVDDASTDGTWDEALAATRERTTTRAATPPADTPGATVVGPETVSTATTDRSADRDQSAEGLAPTELGDERPWSDGGVSMLDERAEVHERTGRLIPIRHRENLGAGGAIKTGYLAARWDGLDITVTMDGDGQMDPGHMSRLLDPIVAGEADYAKGNRLLYREYRAEMPPFRFFGNSILTFLTKIASGYWKTMDPQNGYTAISNYGLENVGVEAMYEYYGYCNDILVRLNAKGMRVADVAMPAKYGDEESSIEYPTYIRKVSGMLLRGFLWRLKVKYFVLDFHPLALFYLFGAAMAGIGTGAFGWTLYSTLVRGSSLFVYGTLSLLLFTVGSVCLMFAMLFDMQVNEDREVQIRD